MTQALIVFGVVATLYTVVGLIVLAVRRPAGWPVADRLIRRYRGASEPAPLDPRLAEEESNAVRQLMDGRIDRSAYRFAMAAVAAEDARKRPLAVPKLRQ